MDRFRRALEDCSLTDLGYMGDMFTWWSNSHQSDNYIREQLDRAVADAAWCNRFPNIRVTNGDPYHSDHRPIIVEMKEEVGDRHNPKGNSLKFEAGWIQEDNCRMIVQNAWNLTMDARAGKVVDAVWEVGADLWNWSRNILGGLEKRISRGEKSWRNAGGRGLVHRMCHG